MESISAFEIIKIGIGPSSSHTMGPWRAAERFIQVIKSKFEITEVVEITTTLFGSLAKTGLGHGTDIAVMMGLTGENFTKIDTDSIPQKIEDIKNSKSLNLNGENEIPFEYSQHIIFDFNKSLDFVSIFFKYEMSV